MAKKHYSKPRKSKPAGKAVKRKRKAQLREGAKVTAELKHMVEEFRYRASKNKAFYAEVGKKDEVAEFLGNKYTQAAIKSKDPKKKAEALRDLKEKNRLLGGITREEVKKKSQDVRDYIKGEYFRDDKSRVEFKALSMHSKDFKSIDTDKLTDEMILQIQRASNMVKQINGAYGVKYHEGLFDALIATRIKMGNGKVTMKELITRAEEAYLEAEGEMIPYHSASSYAPKFIEYFGE